MPRVRTVHGIACPLELRVSFKMPADVPVSRRVANNERVTLFSGDKAISADIVTWARWLCDSMDRLEPRAFYIEFALLLSAARIETTVTAEGPRARVYEDGYADLMTTAVPWLQTDSAKVFIATTASVIPDFARKTEEMRGALLAFVGDLLAPVAEAIAKAMVLAAVVPPSAQNHGGWIVLCHWATLFYKRKEVPFTAAGGYVHSLVDGPPEPPISLSSLFGEKLGQWMLAGEVAAARRAHSRLYSESRDALLSRGIECDSDHLPLSEEDRRRVDAVTTALVRARGSPGDLGAFFASRPSLEEIDAHNPIHVAWLAALELLGVAPDGRLRIGQASAAVPLCGASIIRDGAVFLSVPAYVIRSVAEPLYPALREPTTRLDVATCVADSIHFAARVQFPLLSRVVDTNGICSAISAIAIIRSIMVLPPHLVEMASLSFSDAEWPYPLLDRRMIRRVVANGILARCSDDWSIYTNATTIPGADTLSEHELDMYLFLLPTLLGCVFQSSSELILFLDLSAPRTMSGDKLVQVHAAMHLLAKDMLHGERYLQVLPDSTWTASMLLRFYCLVAETAKRGNVERARDYVAWMEADTISALSFDIYSSPTPMTSIFTRLGTDGPRGLPPLVLPSPAALFAKDMFLRLYASIDDPVPPSDPYRVPRDSWDGLDAL